MLGQKRKLSPGKEPVAKRKKTEFTVLKGFPASAEGVEENVKISDPNPEAYTSRKWSSSEKPQDSFTFMTYNILSTKYALTPKHAYCPKAFRSWDYRWDRILLQIALHDPDIFCLHEVDAKPFADSMEKTFEELGYSIIKYQRGNSSVSRVTCVFAKGEIWDVTKTQVLNLDALPNECFPKHPALCFSLSSLRNTALLVELVNENTKQKLYVVSSHIHWDPRNPDFKALQVYTLLNSVEKQFRTWEVPKSDQRILFGIDLNSVPFVSNSDEFRKNVPENGCRSGAYSLIVDGILEKDHIDHPTNTRAYFFTQHPLDSLEHKLNLKSAYKEILGEEPPWTTKCADFVGCLDYIFYSGLDPINILEMPYGDKSESLSFIPNQDFPSDHLPLVARFAIKEREVEKILDKRFSETLGRHEWLVHWADEAEEQASWEPANKLEKNEKWLTFESRSQC